MKVKKITAESLNGTPLTLTKIYPADMPDIEAFTQMDVALNCDDELDRYGDVSFGMKSSIVETNESPEFYYNPITGIRYNVRFNRPIREGERIRVKGFSFTNENAEDVNRFIVWEQEQCYDIRNDGKVDRSAVVFLHSMLNEKAYPESKYYTPWTFDSVDEFTIYFDLSECGDDLEIKEIYNAYIFFDQELSARKLDRSLIKACEDTTDFDADYVSLEERIEEMVAIAEKASVVLVPRIINEVEDDDWDDWDPVC